MRVSVYPSEFGLQRIQYEQQFGPALYPKPKPDLFASPAVAARQRTPSLKNGPPKSKSRPSDESESRRPVTSASENEVNGDEAADVPIDATCDETDSTSAAAAAEVRVAIDTCSQLTSLFVCCNLRTVHLILNVRV